MIGKNTLRLNNATVLEALQEYFDERYFHALLVLSVDKPYGGEDFVVEVEGKAQQKNNVATPAADATTKTTLPMHIETRE